MFLDMQQKMQESTKAVLPGFQFPGFPGGEKKPARSRAGRKTNDERASR